jgi:protein ImuB
VVAGSIISPPASPGRAHWDTLPIALAEGSRLRAVTSAAARFHVRAGMPVAEARARCAALAVLPWDDVVVAAAIRRATAAFVAASPQVTPVAGAPGLWWIGASGFEAFGGEPALARTLVGLARAWHPRARVAIADSCVAARAGTWETGPGAGTETTIARDLPPSVSRLPSMVIVPPGGCAAYLAGVPLGLVPMDEELRETLAALGIRTAGAFAALPAGDVERRWGDVGLAAWRLARGEDRRRPVLARPDPPRTVATDLIPAVTTMEPVLFLVRAALDRLIHDLVADGRAAATVAITLSLDDARTAGPGPVPTHTVTREVRLGRPLARVLPLLERCRALLDRWLPLSAPVAGVRVSILATAPLAGEQGDLLEPTWHDPAAADAAFARLRAELGADAVVVPAVRDEHRPERAGAWEPVEEVHAAPFLPSPIHAPGRSAGHASLALRQLETPEPIDVECEDGAPRVVWWRGRRMRLQRAVGPERLAGDWWKDGYARDYWRCEEADGESDLVLFHDRAATAGGWFVQGWYD